MEVSVNIRGGTPEAITLSGPNGESASLTETIPGTLSTGDTYYATSQLTKRGTAYYDIILYADPSQKQPPLPTGTWHLDITGSATAAISVDAYVADDNRAGHKARRGMARSHRTR